MTPEEALELLAYHKRLFPEVPRNKPWFAFKEPNMPTTRPRKPRQTGNPKEKKLMETALPEAPDATPKPPEPITCKITLDPNTGTVKIVHNATKPFPTCRQVVAHIPPNLATNAMYYIDHYGWNDFPYLQTLVAYTWGTIPAEAWAKAFCTAVQLLRDTPTEAAAMLPNPAPPVFVAWGDTLYKLTPDSKLAVNDEMAAVRARAEAEAQDKIKSMLAAAEAKKTAILDTANRLNTEIQARVTKARTDLAALRAEASTIPPKWLANSGYSYRWESEKGQWLALLPVNLTISRFDYNLKTDLSSKVLRKSWPADAKKAFLFYVVVPIADGPFNVTSVAAADGVHLPHLRAGSACVAIGDAPTKLTSAKDLANLAASIARAFSVVDLNSLTNSPSEWDSRVWNFVPKDLDKALHAPNWDSQIEDDIRAVSEEGTKKDKSIEKITYEQERKETWTA